jgi:nicotinamidase-related amidase
MSRGNTMMLPATFTTDNTILLLIDFQERLFPVMHEKEKLLNNVLKLTKGALALEIPIIVTEQYPKGLGPTIPEIKGLIPDLKPVEKVCFSCCDEASFMERLGQLGRKQALVAGIEAHICVYQTAAALAKAGYQVEVAGDAIASREAENKAAALTRLSLMGILPTTVEMALFELLKIAKGDKFKLISAIVK